jgi:hypothetical protein
MQLPLADRDGEIWLDTMECTREYITPLSWLAIYCAEISSYPTRTSISSKLKIMLSGRLLTTLVSCLSIGELNVGYE